MKKKIICLLTTLVMVVGLVGVMPTVSAGAAGGVQSKVQAYADKYNGKYKDYYYTPNGSHQCYGYAQLLTENVFGSAFYRNNKNNAFSKVGSASSLSGVINLVKSGDVLNRGTSHTAVVVSKTSSTLVVTHSIGWSHHNGHVETTTIVSTKGYNDYLGGTQDVWRANNYNSIDGGHTCNSNNSYISKNSTCTSTGTRTYTCSQCGKVTRTETISALGHDMVRQIIRPTNTSDGCIRDKCTRCSFYINKSSIKSLSFTSIRTYSYINEKIHYICFYDSTENYLNNEYVIKLRNTESNSEDYLPDALYARKSANSDRDRLVEFTVNKPGLYELSVSISGTDRWTSYYIPIFGTPKKIGQTTYNGHLYTVLDNNKSPMHLFFASHYCKDNNSYLADILSDEENAAVSSIVKQYGNTCLLGGKSGLVDAKSTKSYGWKWIREAPTVLDERCSTPDSSIPYSNFRNDEPNHEKWTNYADTQYNLSNKDNCSEYYEYLISMYPDGTWNDVGNYNESVKGFVMESEAESIDEINAKSECVEGEYVYIDEVKVKFSNGDIVSVDEYTISGYDKNKVGKQTVTVNYFGKTKAFDVNVIHNYKDSVIAPTSTSQGYTLHTCTICGDSYKDNYTNYKPTEILMGDINKDGKITTADVGLANAHAKGTKLLNDEQFKRGDINKDGKVSTADVGLINAYAKGTKKYS